MAPVKQHLKLLYALIFIGLCICMTPEKLWAQTTKVTGESNNVSEKAPPSKQYVYFKVKENSQLIIKDFKAGDNELPAELATLRGIAGIEKIHRPFAAVKTPVLERTYRVQCRNNSNADAIISRLKALPFVEFAVLDKSAKIHIVPNDFRYDKQWGLKKINAEEAWNITTGSSSVTVAVVDVAFRLDHEDLAPVLWTNPGEIPGNSLDDDGNGYIDDVNGWDVADNDNNAAMPYPLAYYDFMNHGTLCASTAVAASNNYKGIASPAYGCKLIPVKTLEDINWNVSSAGHIWDGIAYAIAANADVVSVSAGGYFDPLDPMVAVYQNMIDAGHAAGIVFVASAGNEGVQSLPFPYTGYKIYPASLNHVISVGSSDHDDKKSLFSNWGSVSDVDIYAPGEYIHCASAETTDAYEYATGTSISAPMVAGVCALIKSANPSYSAAQIESCLLNGAFDIDHLNPDYAGLMGAGRVDAKFAVSCSANNTTDFFIQNAQQVCNNTSATFEAVLSDPNYRYFWDFGDGGSANNIVGNTTSHTYTTNGLYTVSLTIKNTLGAVLFTATKSEYVMVTSCNPISSENAHWYFGNKAGLDFTSGKPQAGFDNTINFIGGSTCITDAFNNIAFYGGPAVNTLSYEMNDNTHSYVYTSQSGHMYSASSYAEGGLVLKKPGTSNDYNLFVAPQGQASGEGFYIYDIDPHIPSGYELSTGTPMPAPIGAVLDANNAPYTSSQLTAVKACAAGEYWIITASNNQNSNPESFYIYKFAASPAVSLVNTVSIPVNHFLLSPLKASPDGSMIAYTYGDATDNKIYTKVYTFNRSTGDMQDLVTLEGGTVALSFSPDSKLLYLTGTDNSVFTSYTLYQYDLTSGSPNESRKLVYTSTNAEIFAMQLGPDNVIYVNFGSKQYVGAIYFPNEKITSVSPNACGFTGNAVSLVSSPLQNIHSGKGFPNDVDATEFTIDFSFTPKNCNEVDFKTSICASSYTWYFNDGTSSNLQNPTHVFSTPGTYIVHLDADGQHVFKNVYIHAPFTASLQMNIGICDHSNGIELNATPTGSQYAYKWYRNGVLIDGFSADKYWVSSPGIYHAVVTDTRGGCTSATNTYDYDPNRGFEINMVTPQSFTGFNGVDIGVDVNLYPNSYATYTWFRDGEYFSGPCNCPTINTDLPGTYVVVGNGACGETISGEFRLKIDPLCATLSDVGPPATPLNYQTISGGTWPVSVPPGPLYGTIINGTVTIPSGTAISVFNSNLIMGSCSKIIVEPGGSLTLSKVNITGCNSWEGIIVQGANVNNNGYGLPNSSNGALVMDNCYLSDATIGVYAMDNGYINITNSEFDNNRHHIVINQTPYAPHYSTISFNKFRRVNPGTCMHTYYISPNSIFNPAVVLENVIMANISDNNFISDFFKPAMPPLNSPASPYFNDRSLLLQNTFDIAVTKNHFNKENAVALYASNSIQLNVVDNYFNGGMPHLTRQMTGMYIENSHLFAFNNEFRHCYSGFEYYGTNHASMLIHNNFEDNMYGNIIAPQINPLKNTSPLFNTSTFNINLTIDCNKYLSNNLSIVGSGNLQQQGNSSTDASNSFTNSLEWNILWQWALNPLPTIDYYYGTYTDPNALVGPGYFLNNSFQVSTDITTIALIPPFYSCYGSWKKDVTSTDPVNQSQVNVYPNPFSTMLEVDLNNINAQRAYVKINDIQGKILFESTVEKSAGKITINTPDWAAGVYILTISTDTETRQTKLVKTDY